MTSTLHLILLVFAFVLFAVAAGFPFAEPTPSRIRLIAAGLACGVAAFLPL